MDYSLLIVDEKRWHKDCTRIPQNDLQEINSRIQSLGMQPWPDGIDVKKLHNCIVADFRLRVRDYRVLFNKNNDRQEIRLLRVLHRSKLY